MVQAASRNLPATSKHAKVLGVSTYFTGKRCKNGHLSPRRAVNSGCVQCIQEFEKSRKLSNNEKSRRWIASNREKAAESSRRYKARFPEKINAINAKWGQTVVFY